MRDLPRLAPPHAFPTEPRHLRPHSIPEHARSAVVGRATQEYFQDDRIRLGEGLAALLKQRFGEERIVA
jgi:hypothetical protein